MSHSIHSITKYDVRYPRNANVFVYVNVCDSKAKVKNMYLMTGPNGIGLGALSSFHVCVCVAMCGTEYVSAKFNRERRARNVFAGNRSKS